jgi:DNA polymerase-3 subunit epsilon
MSEKAKFAAALAALFLFCVAVAAACFYAVWSGTDEPERTVLARLLSEQIPAIIVVAFGALAILAAILKAVFARYVSAPKRIAEDTRIIFTSNPRHRATPAGGAEMRELATVINDFGDRHQGALEEVQQRIDEAKARLEEERNRLAALMSELTQSVIVCNIAGQILLYNPRAKQLLGVSSEQHATLGQAALVGIGRSIFAVLDRSVFMHALDILREQLAQGEAGPVAQFVANTASGQLIRAQVAPVLDPSRVITGFVLTLEDVTHAIEAGSRKDELLQSLVEGTRASLGNIRAAIEVLAFPDLEQDARASFTTIIAEESVALSERLDVTMQKFAEYLKTQWPLEDMRGVDLVAAIRRRIEAKLAMSCAAAEIDPALWVNVDSFTIIQAMAYLAHRLAHEHDVKAVQLHLARAGRHAHLDLAWQGAPLATEIRTSWETDPFNAGGEISPLTLQEVAERHGGNVWYQFDQGTDSAYFRLLLPVAARVESALAAGPSARGRPEYYDFDLFNQAGQTAALDERLLSELTYTVFDTETTGLQPSQGDEINAIGALRIVNGRLLYNETFESLVDPQRELSPASIAIHGIQPAALEGQPTIDKVVPAFHRFCEDTVLVGHNAAFDMRFLQIKESRTGVSFTHPVLDTLLLSAVLHPNLDGHRLEAIAERMGIAVQERHSALGDAITTAEVFLRMIPLLAEHGVRTLQEAREASRKSFYARLTY